MGLFDFFLRSGTASNSKPERELAKLERMISSKLSQDLDRSAAIEALGRLASADAVAILLKRFNWYLDPSIIDQEEKEATLRGIVGAGEEAVEPIRDYCRRAESLTWPLKALEQIVERERFGDELLLLLDQFDTEYLRNAEPKVQLLMTLEAHPNESVRVAVEPFLEDASEPVRFAAVGTVFACESSSAVDALVAAIEQEESLRIRNRISAALVARAWTIPQELQTVCSGALPPGFVLRDSLIAQQ